MKNLMRVSSFVFAILLFTNLFTSCKKDEIVDPAPEVTTTTPSSDLDPSTNAAKVMTLQTEGMLNSDSTEYCDCFDIFDGVDWNASEAEIIAQLEIILEGLTDEELEELFIPVCTFDGEFFENACVAICNGVTDFEECEDYDGDIDDWNECFSFVYPLTVVLPDGTNVEVNSDEELITAVEDWYDANPDSDEDPTLVYPVNVLLEMDGSSLTVNNDDELEDLFEMCDEHDDEECFTINFPISIQFPDSTIVENEDVQIIYPFDVTLEDGTLVTINSEEEFDTLIDEECDGDWGGCLVSQDSQVLLEGVKKMANAN